MNIQIEWVYLQEIYYIYRLPTAVKEKRRKKRTTKEITCSKCDFEEKNKKIKRSAETGKQTENQEKSHTHIAASQTMELHSNKNKNSSEQVKNVCMRRRFFL